MSLRQAWCSSHISGQPVLHGEILFIIIMMIIITGREAGTSVWAIKCLPCNHEDLNSKAGSGKIFIVPGMGKEDRLADHLRSLASHSSLYGRL